MTAVSVAARPKINLYLHVTGRREDGYHLLDSLVCFAETGDRITATPDSGLSLKINGPFGAGLDAGGGNLVMRAAIALRGWALEAGCDAPGAALVLEKHLPIASGIGGGSADAAAALNALCALWKLPIPRAALEALALSLGADVPVCLDSRTRVMGGIGEVLEDGPALPPAWIVLVNPLREVSTAAVFKALDLSAPPAPLTMPRRFETAAELGAWLRANTRNDLEAPARVLAPEVDTVLRALGACEGARVARMSGSGATCFAVFDDQNAAENAARKLGARDSGWWIQAAALA